MSEPQWGTSRVLVSAAACSVLLGLVERLVSPVDVVLGYGLGCAAALAYVLTAPRRQRWVVLASVVGASVLLGLMRGVDLDVVIGSACRAAHAGVTVAAAVLVIGRDEDWIVGRRERVGSWLRLLAGSVFAASVGAAMAGVMIEIGQPAIPGTGGVLTSVAAWFLGEATVVALVTPLVLRLRPSYLFGHTRARLGRLPELALTCVVLATLSVLVMLQDHTSLLLVPVVPVTVLLYRHGFVGATIGLVVLFAVVHCTTAVGVGPFFQAPGNSTDMGAAMLWSRLYLLGVIAMTYLSAALQDERLRLVGQRETSEEVYRLIAESSGDLIIVTDTTGGVQYISPAVTTALGTSEAAVLGLRWRDLVHPADFATIGTLAERMDASATRSGATVVRIRRADGVYRWMDARLRLAASGEGEQDALFVCFARDVTESMARHDELVRENDELEAAASTDVLTGLPNRRRLAMVRDEAWADARATAKPLSLLVVDVDRFKAYNDAYGHDAGDRCLVEIARAIGAVLRRSKDFAARYGGEEFVVLLPDTDAERAWNVAESLRGNVRDAAIAHAASPSGVVTVSVGVATTRAVDDDETLFAAADAALYRAKQRGRDRVEAATLRGPVR